MSTAAGGPRHAPCGSWVSPISAQLVAAQSRRLEQIILDGDDVYWIELRPSEGGRCVVVRRDSAGGVQDVTPAPFNARTRVHEYGGGAFTAHRGTVYFANFADQQLYRQSLGQAGDHRDAASAAEPVALTPAVPRAALRYADLVVDPRRDRLICVREDHTQDDEPVNTIVAVGTAISDPAAPGDPGTVLVSGADFYAAPRLSPGGRRLAWLSWSHPNMPWDGNELWTARVELDGSLANPVRVAGGEGESILQPEWSPAGILHFVSDRSGWWNLYRWREGTDVDPEAIQPLAPMEAEFGRPAWVFGQCSYGFVDDNQIICAYTQRGFWHLARLDLAAGAPEPIETPYTDLARYLRVQPARVVFDAGSPSEPTSVVQLDLASGRQEVLRRSGEAGVAETFISRPQAIEFPTSGGLTAHAFFYPPPHPQYAPLPGERPPLLVHSHGGPTSATGTRLQLDVQFWTSRGVAVLDVNYGGSTGYGTAYRRRLNGRWGVVDLDDCVNGARYLAEQGLVDGRRLAISGGSAGGYTTLCALTFRELFAAGASYYGVSDLEALATDTHKFESRYLDSLIGPYPERKDLYVQRSPIHAAERLSCPVIFFQGLEDRVVPPDQAERMVQALRQKGVPVAYLPFEGEQHGFRRAENIARALEAELYFYGRVFGFTPAGDIAPVEIQNLPRRR